MGDPNRDPLQFNVPTEGGAISTVTAKHFDGVDAAAMSKCRFQVGDACNLPINELGTFDGIVAANLLCRLPNPAAFLDALPKLLNRGGVAALTTPFSWLEEFTPKNNWIRPEDFQGEMEARGMELVKPTEPIALTIREHTRKYQYIVAEASVWRK